MKHLFLLAFFTLILIIPAQISFAQTMSNSDYILELGNFNTVAGKSSGGNFNLGITVGQVSPGLYTGANYKVRSGFQYYPKPYPFAFSINQTLIDFGTLTPTNPVLRTNILTVSNQSAGGYSVNAYEDHRLSSSTGNVIPNTSCDTGNCNLNTAGIWTNTLVYGFGYRCDYVSEKNYCPSGFLSSYYKPFADNSASESAQIVMLGKSGKNQKAQITYRVNISGSQFAGTYSNQIYYIATPTF